MKEVIIIRHRYIWSKMKKTRPLMRNRRVSKHIPKMVWYTDKQLMNMLRQWGLVYAKPDNGSSGSGVIRVERVNHAEYIVSWGKKHKVRCRAARLPRTVQAAMLRGKRYVIQRGIHLARVDGKPFDMRVVWQKPSSRWELTWISAKIAPRSDSTVTNVAKGGVDARITPTLRRMQPPVNVQVMRRRIRTVSGRIVHILGARFPVRILGLDMAIDRHRHLWFIEANTNPNFKGLRKLDPVMYRRYARAQRLIRRSSRRRRRRLK